MDAETIDHIERMAQELDSISGDLRLYGLWHAKGWAGICQEVPHRLERLAKDVAALLEKIRRD